MSSTGQGWWWANRNTVWWKKLPNKWVRKLSRCLFLSLSLSHSLIHTLTLLPLIPTNKIMSSLFTIQLRSRRQSGNGLPTPHGDYLFTGDNNRYARIYYSGNSSPVSWPPYMYMKTVMKLLQRLTHALSSLATGTTCSILWTTIILCLFCLWGSHVYHLCPYFHTCTCACACTCKYASHS